MDLTPQTLRSVEFREKLRGYHPDDVDDFLEGAAVALDQLLARLRAAEAGRGTEAAGGAGEGQPAATPAGSGAVPERLASTATPLDGAPGVDPQGSRLPPVVSAAAAPGPGAQALARSGVDGGGAITEETLRRTLLLAQRTADLAVAEAEESARQIVGGAQAQAHQAVAEADARVERTTREARDRVEAAVAELEERRAGLEREVTALQSWASQQRDRLRDGLSSQLRALDQWLQARPPTASLMTSSVARAGVSASGGAVVAGRGLESGGGAVGTGRGEGAVGTGRSLGGGQEAPSLVPASSSLPSGTSGPDASTAGPTVAPGPGAGVQIASAPSLAAPTDRQQNEPQREARGERDLELARADAPGPVVTGGSGEGGGDASAHGGPVVDVRSPGASTEASTVDDALVVGAGGEGRPAQGAEEDPMGATDAADEATSAKQGGRLFRRR